MLAPVLTESRDEKLRQAVQQVMIDRLGDGSPLAQAAAIDALEPLGPTIAPHIRPLLQAPYRLARVKAAWTLRQEIELTSPAGLELANLLRYSLDQPTGAFRWANFLNETGKPQEALAWYAKVVEWDPHSAPFHHEYAVALSKLGRLDEALAQMAEALRIAPNEAIFSHSLGLIYGEMNRLPEARDALQRAVQLAPAQSRFWYNLGLAETHLGNADAALAALEKAEELDPTISDYPYARATIYLGLNRREQARAALQQVLRINPQHEQAQRLARDL
jgi:tetratricopeptide (TPR) repeat protein